MKNTFFALAVSGILLLLLETGSFIYLWSVDDQKKFLVNIESSPQVFIDYFAFDQFDPLLGWSMSYDNVKALGFELYHNAVLLNGKENSCDRPLVIYISGGSATDMTFDRDNWPKYLHELLDENQYCSKIYVGAVAGYNSGQELLKIIRDRHKIEPDIHLSYSGANEPTNAGYTTEYEHLFYTSNVESQAPIFLPNTIYLLRNLLFPSEFNVKAFEQVDPIVFWEDNMKNMQALSIQHKYFYIGLLQPVYGFGSENSSGEIPENIMNKHLKDYQSFYPAAMDIADKYGYLYDLTAAFSHLSEEVIFKDDCHLMNSSYQKIIAKEVYQLILPKLEKYKTEAKE
ncbi:MAG: hypothetical protein WD048_11895 [Chitinophagales bacterium]